MEHVFVGLCAGEGFWSKAGLLIVYMVFESWLGLTRNVKSASTLELIVRGTWTAMMKLAGRNPKENPAAAPPTPGDTNVESMGSERLEGPNSKKTSADAGTSGR